MGFTFFSSTKENMAAQEDPLGVVLTEGIDFIQKILPGWKPPNLAQLPYAKPKQYKNAYDMLIKLRPGAQIMIKTASGYRHHGIFVGLQIVPPEKTDEPAVVDVWGHDKQHSKISLRPYSDFVAGGVIFAEANYPAGEALSKSISARLALAMAANTKDSVYNAAFNNCEHFATMCRCLRCVMQIKACFKAIDSRLDKLPLSPPPLPRGFIGI
jgi:hypothetical protein